MPFRHARRHLRQQIHAEHHHDHAQRAQEAVVLDPPHQETGGRRRAQQAEHHRRDQRAGVGCRDAENTLEHQRREEDRAEHAEGGEKADEHRHRECRVFEQVQRDNRLLNARLRDDEGNQHHNRQREQSHHLRRTPCVVARDGQGDKQRHHAARQGERTDEVDVAPRRFRAHVRETGENNQHRDDADRDVHLEHPPPAPVVGDPAAGRRADDRAQAEDGAEQTSETSALRGREQVADHGEHGREQHATEQALHAARDDELRHVLRESAQGGHDDEADHAHEQEGLSPEQVAELPGDGGHRRGGDQVGRRHPGETVQPVEVGDDPRDGRADDRLVECGQKQRQHGAGGGQDDLRSGES